MDKVIILILDKFADWEPAFVASWLQGDLAPGRYEVLFASTDKKPKRSIGNMNVLPDLSWDDVPFDAKALILIGADDSWRKQAYPQIVALAQRFKQEGKVLGAICDAARFAGANGLLNDVIHTFNDPDELRNEAGYTNAAGYLAQDAVRGGNVITANGNAPAAFAAEIARALGAAEEKDIQMHYDFYTMGLFGALRKYGYIS
jgi:putative intracellular protease/amidase